MPTELPVKTKTKYQKLEETAKAIGEISLPVFIMILLAAMFLDISNLAEAIPVLGIILSIFNGFASVVLWIIYWSVGARGFRNAVIMALDALTKMIPVLNLLPLNTITAIVVYLLGKAWVRNLISSAASIGGKLAKKVASRAGGAAKMAEQVA